MAERYEACEFLSNVTRIQAAQILDPLYTAEVILSRKFLSQR